MNETRLVCRSAPLETKHIAAQMEEDVLSLGPGSIAEWRCVRAVVAEPKDTDNAQCWSEEIFSQLEAP